MIDLMSSTGGRLSHYFFGGGPGVTDELVARLKARFPELDVAGHHEPPFGIGIDDATSDVDRIVRSGANVIWVGLGHPKQELWMRRHRDRFAGMLLGVGAAFDFHSGRKKEAPRWMKSAGLQWLHRLVKEPRRLWRRYFVGNTRFLWLLLRSRGSKTLR
jgi:N-acetylglucosaminyldiphosphoundecaprenol N-acetyl-beta-D-mannosaminyltransferase